MMVKPVLDAIDKKPRFEESRNVLSCGSERRILESQPTEGQQDELGHIIIV